MRHHYQLPVPPVTEPYSPIVPHRREKQRIHIEIVVMVVFGIFFLGWIGSHVKAAYDRGNPAFTGTAENVRRALAGE